jgi:DtxR family Mn-dependent transcriptional regulator
MVRRHRIIETWLVQTHGYRWDEVHDEAEILEHALSDRLLDLIDEQLGHPVRDPHGDPIPTSYGHLTKPEAVLLRDAAIGTVGRVARVSDSDPLLLRHLEAETITLDRELTVLGRAPDGGAFAVRVEGAIETRDLGDAALEAIWITPSSTPVELPAQ